MKKILICTLAALFAVATIAGCSSNTASSSAASSSTSSSASSEAPSSSEVAAVDVSISEIHEAVKAAYGDNYVPSMPFEEQQLKDFYDEKKDVYYLNSDTAQFKCFTLGFQGGGEKSDYTQNEAYEIMDKVLQLVKTDKEAAGRRVYTALRAIDSLKVLFAPVLPFTSERLNQILGYEHHLFGNQYIQSVSDSLGEHRVNCYDPADAKGCWVKSELPAGQKFGAISPLFKKLDASIIETERAKLGNK